MTTCEVCLDVFLCSSRAKHVNHFSTALTCQHRTRQAAMYVLRNTGAR